MNPDIFAEWLRRQGHRVVRTASSHWYSDGVRALQAFPYHWTIEPSERELRDLLRRTHAICLRYSAPVSSLYGCLSYHMIRAELEYTMEGLGKRTRKNVRRALRNCSVEPIGFDLLAEEGWALQLDTLERQNRRVRVSRRDWQRRCLSAMDLPGFEAWGALVGDRLAASVTTFRVDDWVYILSQQSHREFLAALVNNALTFTVTQVMLRRPGVRSIFYGLQSLDAPSSVDEFKVHMGYSARVVRQRVVFHPYFEPLVNPALHALFRTAQTFSPGNPVLAKAEGMIHSYLEGKRPLDKQAKHPLFSQAEEIADDDQIVNKTI